MAQDRNLPEGTDRVVPGASAGASGGEGEPQGGRTVTADTTLVSEREVPAPAGDAERTPRAGSTRSGDREGRGGKIMDKVRSGSDKLSAQAADKTRDYVGQGLERTGDALGNVGRLVADTASGLDERLGPEYGDYARRAAEAIDNTARKLRSKDPDELIDDTRTFVRKSPGIALAGAAIVGFALARLVKTGLDNTSRDTDRERTDRTGGAS